ncbi:MAG: hypothetical protein U1E36_01195 [Rickettsiales bacterium]
MAYGDPANNNLFSGPISPDNGPTTFGEMDAQAIREHSHDAAISEADKAAADTIINRAISEGWSAEQLRNSGINPAFLNQGLDRHKQAMEASGSNPEMTKVENDKVKAEEMSQLQQGILGGSMAMAGLGGFSGLFGDDKTAQEKQQDMAALDGIGGAMTLTSVGTMGGMAAVPAIAKEFGSLSQHAKGGEHAYEEDLFVSIRPGQTPAPAMAAARAQQEARNEQFVRGASTPR